MHDVVEQTHKVVEGTDGKVVKLLDASSRIEKRIEDNIPRRDPSEPNKRIYIHTIIKCHNCCCPCGCRQKIVDEKGNALLDERGQPLLEISSCLQ